MITCYSVQYIIACILYISVYYVCVDLIISGAGLREDVDLRTSLLPESNGTADLTKYESLYKRDSYANFEVHTSHTHTHIHTHTHTLSLSLSLSLSNI